MSTTFPRGEDDPLERLARVRAAFGEAEDYLFNLLTAFTNEDCDNPSSAKVSDAKNIFLKSLINLQTLEVDLEKRGYLTLSRREGQLDCASAKAEILARLARIRDRG